MDEKETSKQVSTELEIENMREFLLENQDIKLENLPRYEDLISPESKTEQKIEGMQEVSTLPFFETKQKVKEAPKPDLKAKKRFKIAASCFAVVGVLLASLVCINGVALAVLTQKSKDNQKEVTTLTQEVDELQYEYELNNSDEGVEKVSYRLALPRNYPKDTADLTWFDKLSIFLMKLFG